MLLKSYSKPLTKYEISKLRGGPKHNFRNFVVILHSAGSDVITEVRYAKLENQMASQRSTDFPEGYEPFMTRYGTTWFDLARMTIETPRLVLHPTRGPSITLHREAALIMNPKPGTEDFEILHAAALQSDVKDRIRRHAAVRLEKLELVVSLMKFAPGSPIWPELDRRFEAYLLLRDPGSLRDLLGLLDLPDSEPLQTPQQLAVAA